MIGDVISEAKSDPSSSLKELVKLCKSITKVAGKALVYVDQLTEESYALMQDLDHTAEPSINVERLETSIGKLEEIQDTLRSLANEAEVVEFSTVALDARDLKNYNNSMKKLLDKKSKTPLPPVEQYKGETTPQKNGRKTTEPQPPSFGTPGSAGTSKRRPLKVTRKKA